MNNSPNSYINLRVPYSYIGTIRDESGCLKAQFRQSSIIGALLHAVGYYPTVQLTKEECTQVTKMFREKGDWANANTFLCARCVIEERSSPEPQQ